MSVRFDNIDGPLPVRPVPEPRPNGGGANRPQGADFARQLATVATVASPPPEVSAEVQAAARAAARLHELGRELRFEQDDDGRLRVELRDRDGNVLRQVPTSEVFDFAAGKVTT
jgi:flagellar protein FlaG